MLYQLTELRYQKLLFLGGRKGKFDLNHLCQFESDE